MSLFDFYGGLVGAGASMLSSAQQYQYQRKLQAQAAQLNYDYGQKSLLNSPTSTRQGLENAGYNPMLAVNNATAGANSGWTSTGQANGTDYASGISQFVSNAQNAMRIKNETAQTESAVKTNEATARNQNAEASNREAENPFISDRNKADIGRMNAQTANLSHQNDLIDAQIENMQKRIELERALGFAGLDVARRGQDIGYAGTVYNANSMSSASRYHSNKIQEIADMHSPSSRSQSFNNYAGGVSGLLHGVSSFLPLRGGNANYVSEEFVHSYRDKFGHHTRRVKKSGRSK